MTISYSTTFRSFLPGCLLLLIAGGSLLTSGVISVSPAMADNDGISPSGGKSSYSGFDSIGRDGENIISGCGFIEGTNSDDFIIACDLDNVVYGKDGDDEIQTSFGRDKIHGGHGDDVIQSYLQNDLVFGNDGDDSIVASDGNDLLDGGKGDDHLYAGFGDDQLVGGPGADFFDCGEGVDEVKDYDPEEGDVIAGANCDILRDFP